MLTKLYSHPLPEMWRLAGEAHVALNQTIPRYVERSSVNHYLAGVRAQMDQLANKYQLPSFSADDGYKVELLPDTDLTSSTIAQMLFPHSELPTKRLREIVTQFTPEQRSEVIKSYHGYRENRRQRPGRALEDGYPIKFEIQADFGIYRDLHRQRMLTQERQPLTTHLGFASIPEVITQIGAEAEVEKCIRLSQELYEDLRRHLGKYFAQYAVLFGFNIRWTMGMNLREAMHFLELRTIKQGHQSYRLVAQEMHRQILARYPEFAAEMKFVDYNEYESARADSEAYQRQREAQLTA